MAAGGRALGRMLSPGGDRATFILSFVLAAAVDALFGNGSCPASLISFARSGRDA